MNKEEETQKAERRVSPALREEMKQEKEGEREGQRQTKTPKRKPCLRLTLTSMGGI